MVQDDLDDQFEQQLRTFIEQIDSQGDTLVDEFKTRLNSETGRLVARDRIGWVAERLRNEARDQAIPAFLDRYFADDGSINGK